jgi:LuxR family transcriptional regulator, maltose regulon positive regulatory protein
LLEPLLPDPAVGQVDIRVALARAYLRDDDPSGAVEALPAWEDDRAAATPLAVRIDAGLIDALAAQRHGDQRRSAWALERVLQLAEPEGYRRLFTGAGPATRDLMVAHLDSGTAYWSLLGELVAAVGASSAKVVPSTPRLGEPLTDRELMVLRYLQSVLSTAEIASELYLSVNTVKTHLRNIYRKLDTTRRREAVRRGRELHLL